MVILAVTWYAYTHSLTLTSNRRPLVETQLNTDSSTLHVHLVCESIDDNDYNSKQSSLLSPSLLLFKCLSEESLVVLTLLCAVFIHCQEAETYYFGGRSQCSMPTFQAMQSLFFKFVKYPSPKYGRYPRSAQVKSVSQNKDETEVRAQLAALPTCYRISVEVIRLMLE
uniref:Uncharacterized protein n=1 Tax=Glossina austeni TaxID=7395 RepID=A0A1A9VHM3_GLOAU